MSALRGVNLGGWLVLEKWMTPALFAGTDAVDHYTFMRTPGALEKIEEFQRDFIREEDFQWLRDHGIGAVRIPIGYWIIDGGDHYAPCIERLDWAFRMAKKYDIEVLVCLHGAPGSQNGQDHSGRVGPIAWYASDENHRRTIDVLVQVATRYRDHPRFWGLELLNEPRIRVFQRRLRRFYRDAYKRLTGTLHARTRVIFSDGFTPRLMNGAIRGSVQHPVAMDIHWYHFIFWAHRFVSLAFYYRYVVAMHGRVIRRLRRTQPIIIGEWNGIISGEVLRHYPEREHNIVCVEHIRRQLEVYESADAWFYWNYKTQDRGIFHFRSFVEDGYIPLDS